MCFVGAVVYSMHYIWRCRGCSSSSKTLTYPSWRSGFSHGPDLSAVPYVFSQLPYTWWLSRLCSCFKCHRCSSEYERRCTHAATSSSSSLCRMGPRPVHRPLCWERLRGILLRPGRGYASFGDECGNVLGDPKRFCAEDRGFLSEAVQFPFRFCKLAKRRSKRLCAEDRGFLSEAVQFPFGFARLTKRRSKTFLCGESRLPFGSGAIPFRVCKLAKRRSKRFCAEDRGFLSEAVQFPFGFAS